MAVLACEQYIIYDDSGGALWEEWRAGQTQQVDPNEESKYNGYEATQRLDLNQSKYI